MDNLVNITMSDDDEDVYAIGLGCHIADLTEKEVNLLKRSSEYLKNKVIKHNKFIVKSAYEDFEKLSKIHNMPLEALEIISHWVDVDGFNEEEE